MGWLARILLGRGTFKPDMRAALEQEGVAVLEENLAGSLRYHRFRAPGKRFDGKVVPVRLALAVTGKRLVAYSGSGRHKLMDSPWDSPNLRALSVRPGGEDALEFHVDYGKLDEPGVSGEITIRVRTPSAATIAGHVHARLGS